MALSTEQHYSGGSYLDVDTIIFEEFMERGQYIKNEPDKFMILYSTIDRKQGRVKVWMVGNTISQVCPYFDAWGILDIFKKIKQGEIKEKIIHNDANDVKIAIEYCKASGGKTMTLGNASSMIEKGAWQTVPQPKLPMSYNKYKVMYRFGLYFKNLKFLAEYLLDEKNKTLIWFIKPYEKEFDEKTIVFSDIIKPSKYWQRNIYDISINNDRLKSIFQTFKEEKIFYASDLCGTDFKQVIDFSIRR